MATFAGDGQRVAIAKVDADDTATLRATVLRHLPRLLSLRDCAQPEAEKAEEHAENRAGGSAETT